MQPPAVRRDHTAVALESQPTGRTICHDQIVGKALQRGQAGEGHAGSALLAGTADRVGLTRT
jgi:hypothetical protein